MNITDILDVINDIEDKFPVDEWELNSIHIWPAIRVRYYFALRDAILSGMAQDRKAYKYHSIIVGGLSLVQRYIKYLHAYLYDIRNNAKPNYPADAIFLGDQISRILIMNKWYDKLCEPIIEYLDKRNITSFHMDPNHDYRIPRHNHSMFVQTQLDYVEFKTYLLRKKHSLIDGNLDGIDGLYEYLKLNNCLAGMPSKGEIRMLAIRIRLLADHFEKILKRVNPSIAFLVEYYSVQSMAFNLACHEFGIQTVDIPHGAKGSAHVAYERWNKIPGEGYALLPSIFWCWDYNDASIISKWSNKASAWHRPIVGGNLIVSQWMSNDNPYGRYYDEKIANFINKYKDYAHILYTLNNLSDAESDKLIEIIKAVGRYPLKCFFWIRVHPCRLSKKKYIMGLLKGHGITNFELRIATSYPLYALLRNVDIHITEFSSTVVEASQCGVPTVIINKIGAKLFQNEVNSGGVVTAYKPIEVVSAIQTLLRSENIRPRKKENSYGLEYKVFDYIMQIIDQNKIKKTVFPH